jgi:hypothetical protein
MKTKLIPARTDTLFRDCSANAAAALGKSRMVNVSCSLKEYRISNMDFRMIKSFLLHSIFLVRYSIFSFNCMVPTYCRYWLNSCFFLAIAAVAVAAPAQQLMPGGYAAASVTDKEVVAAADFAIKAQQKAMQKKGDEALPKLDLVTILEAAQQVVAGMNYRLTLKVKLEGKEKTAEVIVWWQAWRKPNPYELTSWNWK